MYIWAMGIFLGMQFDFFWSRFSGEVWSSISEELQKIQGEPLSQNASEQESEQTNKASEPADQQASKQASNSASKRVNKPTGRQAKRAREQTR